MDANVKGNIIAGATSGRDFNLPDPHSCHPETLAGIHGFKNLHAQDERHTKRY